ncbi:MAG: SCO family protein [Colwellia sp.]
MNKLIFGLIAFIAAIVGVLFFQQIYQLPLPEHALYYQQPRIINDFELTDQQGNSFNKTQLVDKWSLVFFGYTSCPDVCPTTLQNLSFIYDDLKKTANNSQVLLVSVDPKRDSQEKLALYINYFNSEFKALRAEHDVLFPFARHLGLMYAISSPESANKNPNDSSNHYLVDHSASIVLINPVGKIVAIFRPEQVVGQVPSIDSDKLLSDFQKIVALY